VRHGDLELTWTKRLSAGDAAAFDAFVDASPYAHYSQTRTWARITAAGYPIQPRYFLARDRDGVVGAAVVLRPGWPGLVAPIAWIERGPVVADPGRLREVLAAVISASRRRGAAWLRVMPYADGDARLAIEGTLAKARFKDIQRTGATHAYTLRLEVAGRTDDDLVAGSERETLRRKLRQAAKAGATVRRLAANEFDVLVRLYGELMRSQGRKSNPAGWFDAVREAVRTEPDRYAVFACEKDGEALNATLIVRHGPVATFVMGASGGGKAPFSKAVLPMVEGARWARDIGCAVFDLGGVPDPGDTDEKRTSIAQFKNDFSKAVVRLVHEHSRWLLW
jgi:lipid II:glycine glycyltransferase (peptidoglycan interpeptide bridge formation enzyme)